jgi:hypothetical protein
MQQTNHPVAGEVTLHEIANFQRRLAKKILRPLRLQHQQSALNSTEGRRRNIAVFCAQRLRILSHPSQHGPQVFEVHEQHAFVIGDGETGVEQAGLRFVQLQQ